MGATDRKEAGEAQELAVPGGGQTGEAAEHQPRHCRQQV